MEIKQGTYSLKEIQNMGGFEKLRENGFEYYELYHKLPNGEFEGHNLFEVFIK